MADFITVSGLEDVQKALYSYSTKLGDFVIYKALRSGANLVKARVQSLAPVYSGNSRPVIKSGTLRKGFRVVKSKINNGKRKPEIGVFLTLKKGGGRSDPADPFYGRWQELGWNARGKKATTRAGIRTIMGSRSGRKSEVSGSNVKGKFFMDKAFEQTKNQAADLIVASARAGADVLAKREGL